MKSLVVNQLLTKIKIFDSIKSSSEPKAEQKLRKESDTMLMLEERYVTMLAKFKELYSRGIVTFEEWKEIEKEYNIQTRDGFLLSEVLEWDFEGVVGERLVLIIKNIFEGLKITFEETLGKIIVDVYYDGLSLIEFIPNAPRGIVDSDINSIEVYLLQFGYWIPAKWELYKEIEVKWDFILNLEAGVDGATSVRIIGPKIL